MTQKEFLLKWAFINDRKTGEIVDRREELLSDINVLGCNSRCKSVENKKWVLIVETRIKEIYKEIDALEDEETNASDLRILQLTEITEELQSIIDKNRGPRFFEKSGNVIVK